MTQVIHDFLDDINELHIYESNKLLCYDAKLLHQPEGFPEDRLVITFFC